MVATRAPGVQSNLGRDDNLWSYRGTTHAGEQRSFSFRTVDTLRRNRTRCYPSKSGRSSDSLGRGWPVGRFASTSSIQIQAQQGASCSRADVCPQPRRSGVGTQTARPTRWRAPQVREASPARTVGVNCSITILFHGHTPSLPSRLPFPSSAYSPAAAVSLHAFGGASLRIGGLSKLPLISLSVL